MRQPATRHQKQPSLARPCLANLCGSAVLAVVLGVGLAMAGVWLVSGSAQLGASPADTAYLTDLPQDEDMLRQLSRELASTPDDVAQSFNDIAPAAGAPLGQ